MGEMRGVRGVIFLMLVATVALSAGGCAFHGHYHVTSDNFNTSVPSDRPVRIEIHNRHDENVEFYLNVNGIVPLSFDDIIKLINQIAVRQSIPDYQAAHVFLTKSSSHYGIYSETFMGFTQPEIFINSLGRAVCGDMASALALIWVRQGYQARLVSLKNHTIPEIHDGVKWKLFDPDLGVYFLNRSGEVASVQELSEDSGLFKNYRKVSRKGFTNHASTKNYKPHFSFENKIFYTDIRASDFHVFAARESIMLPAHSVMIITSSDHMTICSLEVELNERSHGLLRVPYYIPYSGNGKGVIMTRQGQMQFDGMKRFDREHMVDFISIVEVGRKTTISYLTNPYLSIVGETIDIAIESRHKLTVKIRPNKKSCNRAAIDFYVDK